MKMMKLTIAMLCLCSFWVAAEEAPRTLQAQRPKVTGVVLDDAGRPLSGVEYYISKYRRGNSGTITYTGWKEKEKTSSDGVFICEYGGAGRAETEIDIVFTHPDFAPSWLKKVKESEGDHKVTLAPGVLAKGKFDQPTSATFEVGLFNPGEDVDINFYVTTDFFGNFSFRMPENYEAFAFNVYLTPQPNPFSINKTDKKIVLDLHKTISIEIVTPDKTERQK